MAKPGQVLIFGLLHQCSGDVALRLLLALLGAGLSLMLGRIAVGIGGGWAGFCGAALSVGAFSEFVRGGDSHLFLIPLLFGGLLLYYYRPQGMKKWGLLLLVLAPLFRIEAAAAVVIVLLIHLLRREWKEFAAGAGALALSMGIWLIFMFRIQLEISRFTSAEAGYMPGPRGPFLSYFLGDLKAAFSYYSTAISLSLLATGAAGVALRFREWRRYLIALVPVSVIFVNYIFLGGSLATRHFEATFAFGLSVGVGVLFAASSRLRLMPRKGFSIPAAALVLLPGLVFYLPSARRLAAPPPPLEPYVADGLGLCAEKLIPAGSRLLSEDDALYVLLMNAPDRFRKVRTLQQFNISGERGRAETLADTDFIYLLKGGYAWYYLNIDSTCRRPGSGTDKFMTLIREIMRSNSGAGIYGVTLTPLVNDAARLVLKVERRG